jgi:hypothetical protein
MAGSTKTGRSTLYLGTAAKSHDAAFVYDSTRPECVVLLASFEWRLLLEAAIDVAQSHPASTRRSLAWSPSKFASNLEPH